MASRAPAGLLTIPRAAGQRQQTDRRLSRARPASHSTGWPEAATARLAQGIEHDVSDRAAHLLRQVSRVRETPAENRRHSIVGLPSRPLDRGRTMQLASLTIIYQSVAFPRSPSFLAMPPQSPRPRAADDFSAIRARMEELRRERTRVPPDNDARRESGPRPNAISDRPGLAHRPGPSPAMRRGS